MPHLLRAALLALLTLHGAAAMAADSKPLYLAHLNKNDATDNGTAAMAVAFKAALGSASETGIRVEIFPEGQLGNDPNVVELVRKGVIQSAISSVGGLSTLYPLIGVLDYPFAFRGIEDAYRVLDGPFGDRLRVDIQSRTDMAVLGFGDTGGLFVITNSKHPVRTPAEMAGLRIRAMGLPSHQSFLRSLGAEPVSVAWSELYSALQSGVADGQMNPPSIVRFGQLDEVQRYLTVTNHFYTPYVWVANASYLAGLDAAQRQAVEQAARAGIEASRKLARDKDAAGAGLNALARRLKVHELSESEIAAFRAKAQPTMAAFIAEKLGPDGVSLLDAFRAAIAEAEKPRVR
ncbi:MAG: TRAP transporter substrate-binding protein DctP [Alphaproteobacteria bacterium]